MLLALLAFRRRAVLAALLAVGLLPWMSDVQAQAPAAPASQPPQGTLWKRADQDRKSTRLNSSHSQISYAVFCLKKKKTSSERSCPETARQHLSASASSTDATFAAHCPARSNY